MRKPEYCQHGKFVNAYIQDTPACFGECGYEGLFTHQDWLTSKPHKCGLCATKVTRIDGALYKVWTSTSKKYSYYLWVHRKCASASSSSWLLELLYPTKVKAGHCDKCWQKICTGCGKCPQKHAIAGKATTKCFAFEKINGCECPQPCLVCGTMHQPYDMYVCSCKKCAKLYKSKKYVCLSCACSDCCQAKEHHKIGCRECNTCISKSCKHSSETYVSEEVYGLPKRLGIPEIAARFYTGMERALVSGDMRRDLFSPTYAEEHEAFTLQAATWFANYLDMIIGGEIRYGLDREIFGDPDSCQEAMPIITTIHEYNQRRASRGSAWYKWYHLRNEYGIAVLEEAEEAFRYGNWSGCIGGNAWAEVAKVLLRFLKGEISPELFVDLTFALEHNGGCVFNKKYDTPKAIRAVLDANLEGNLPMVASYLKPEEQQEFMSWRRAALPDEDNPTYSNCHKTPACLGCGYVNCCCISGDDDEEEGSWCPCCDDFIADGFPDDCACHEQHRRNGEACYL